MISFMALVPRMPIPTEVPRKTNPRSAMTIVPLISRFPLRFSYFTCSNVNLQRIIITGTIKINKHRHAEKTLIGTARSDTSFCAVIFAMIIRRMVIPSPIQNFFMMLPPLLFTIVLVPDSPLYTYPNDEFEILTLLSPHSPRTVQTLPSQAPA